MDYKVYLQKIIDKHLEDETVWMSCDDIIPIRQVLDVQPESERQVYLEMLKPAPVLLTAVLNCLPDPNVPMFDPVVESMMAQIR